MTEQIFAHWLTNTDERSLQMAFAELLVAEKHEIITISSHGAGEHGKDIVSKDKDGTYHGYQLKVEQSGTLSLQKWRKIRDEVFEASEVPIEHPSIPAGSSHIGWFVINADLTSDVTEDIEKRNRKYDLKKEPRLHTLLKGQLLQRFLSQLESIVPEKPEELAELLSFHLDKGDGPLPKKKFERLINNAFPDGINSLAEKKRRIPAAALLSLYGLKSFREKKNWVSIIDGLVITIALIFRWAERHKLPKNSWHITVNQLKQEIENAVVNLSNEILGQDIALVEGNVMVDQPYYRYRITKLLGYLSGAHLSKILEGIEKVDISSIKHINSLNHSLPMLWGEAAMPQLAWFGLLEESISGSRQLIKGWLEALLKCNDPEIVGGLPSPYYDEEKVLKMNLALEPRTRETFVGRSFTLRSLVDLMVRRNEQVFLSGIWSQISEIQCIELEPSNKSDYLLINSPSGKENARLFDQPQSWKKLQQSANRTNDLPDILQTNIWFLPFFLLAYPQRFSPPFLSAIDSKLLPKIGKTKKLTPKKRKSAKNDGKT